MDIVEIREELVKYQMHEALEILTRDTSEMTIKAMWLISFIIDHDLTAYKYITYEASEEELVEKYAHYALLILNPTKSNYQLIFDLEQYDCYENNLLIQFHMDISYYLVRYEYLLDITHLYFLEKSNSYQIAKIRSDIYALRYYRNMFDRFYPLIEKIIAHVDKIEEIEEDYFENPELICIFEPEVVEKYFLYIDPRNPIWINLIRTQQVYNYMKSRADVSMWSKYFEVNSS